GTSAINGTGNGLANILTGNSGANTLNGGAGDDTLDGGGGSDHLNGSTGNDTYAVDLSTDVITENSGEGTDTVLSSATTYTLSANVENLTLTGSGNLAGIGNTLANVITGNSGNNALDDGGTVVSGTDTLIGGLGDDTFTVHNTTDVIIENSLEGTDLV